MIMIPSCQKDYGQWLVTEVQHRKHTYNKDPSNEYYNAYHELGGNNVYPSE